MGLKKDYPIEYATWCRIRNRVKSEKDCKYYANISVCERWQNSFSNFLSDMGTRPPDKSSIERLDGSKDYEPNNCVWADAKQQSWNRRGVRMVTIADQTAPILVWADFLGISRSTVSARIAAGWTEMDALFMPLGVRNYNKLIKLTSYQRYSLTQQQAVCQE